VHNPPVRFFPDPARIFHRDRNLAIILGLLDSAACVGEMLSQKQEQSNVEEGALI